MPSAIKRILKSVALGSAKLIPSTGFTTYVDSFADAPRGKSRISSYYERAINYLHREISVAKLREGGIWFKPTPLASSRFEIYDYVSQNFIDAPVDYLEFGVFRGESIRWALATLPEGSRVFGFDSFEGLPDSWYYGVPKGEFAVGHQPNIEAPNLRFVKGWFEETLEQFLSETPLQNRLVLHLDADLYGPTIYVLRTLGKRVAPGTIVIFDEYWFVKDEYRALRDYVTETGARYEFLAVTDTRAAIRFI